MNSLCALKILIFLLLTFNSFPNSNVKKLINKTHQTEKYIPCESSRSQTFEVDTVSVKSLVDYYKKNKNQNYSREWVAIIEKFRGIDDPKVINILSKELLREKYNDDNKRTLLINILAESKSNIAIESLIKLLKERTGYKIELELIETLGYLKNPIALEPLISKLYSLKYQLSTNINSKKSIIAIFEALGKIGGNKALEVIISNLNYFKEEINIAAVESLLESQDPEAVKYLNNVRNQNVKNLVRVNKKGKLILENRLKDHDWEKAEIEDSFKSYSDFLKIYPMSEYSKIAIEKLRNAFNKQHKLKVDSMWNSTCFIDNIQAYEHFLINNPSSIFIEQARKRFSELRYDEYINSIKTASETAKLETQTQNKEIYFHPMVILPIISECEYYHLIYKDENYQYRETKESGAYKILPEDYELLKLRYSKPYEACVLFIPKNKISKNTKSKSNEFSFNIFSNLIDDAKRYISVGDKLEFNIFFASPTFINPKTEWEDFFFENLIKFATFQKESEIILDVIPDDKETLSYERVVKQLMQDLFELLNSNNRRTSYSALEILSYLDSSLGKEIYISDPKSLDPLVDMLLNWDNEKRTIKLLNSFDWKPTTLNKKIYYAVADHDKKFLLNNWGQTKRLLLNSLRSGNYSVVYSFIGIGNDDIIPDLIRFINQHGNKTVLEIYINSGKSELVRAGRNWASRNNYKVITGAGAHFVSWGRFR